jgi:hypothetical protein
MPRAPIHSAVDENGATSSGILEVYVYDVGGCQ